MIKNILTFATTFFILASSLHAHRCETDRLSLETEDAINMLDVVNGLAQECQISVVYADSDTHKRVKDQQLSPLYLIDKPLTDIFEIILGNNNFNYTLEDDILTIAHVRTVTFKVDYIDTSRTGESNTDVTISGASSTGGTTSSSSSSSSASSGGSAGGGSGAIIKTEEVFDFWEDLSSNLEELLTRPEDGDESYDASIVINRKSGLVTVSGTRRQLERVETYIDRILSSLRKQVLIDVHIINVSLDHSNKTGVDWSKFSLDFNYDASWAGALNDAVTNSVKSKTESSTLIINNDAGLEMNGIFNFLRTYGDARSLSSPKVLAINNQPTMISVGDNINYLVRSSTTTGTTSGSSSATTNQPQSIFVGVLLDITAQIDDNDFITLRINPSISEFKYTTDAQPQAEPRQLPPDTVNRRISSVVRVKDGDSIILGGLISSTKGTEINKVALLGDIPVLGHLFKSEDVTDIQSEIVFVLKPRIVRRDHFPSIEDLGFELSTEMVESAMQGASEQ